MDAATLLLALAVGNLALYAALLFHAVDQRRPHGLGTWRIARQAQAAAWLLWYFRGALPELIGGPVATILLLTGLAFDAGALWENAGRRNWHKVLLPALAVAAAACLSMYLGGVDPVLRRMLAAIVAAGFLLSGVVALGRGWIAASMLRRFMAVASALAALVIAGCALAPWARLEATWLLPTALGAFYVTLLVQGAGLLLLRGHALQQELARLEVVDVLTDVPNRRGFYQALAPWLALARRPGPSTALIILNFDQFKRVNDHYGHTVGDLVLKTVIGACRRQLRDSDLIGRLGGAEFAVQLPRTGLPEAVLVAERIRQAVAALPVKAERAVINLTASMGVTTIRPDDSTVSLFKRADDALQAAKLRGRNQVVAADPAAPMDEPDFSVTGEPGPEAAAAASAERRGRHA